MRNQALALVPLLFVGIVSMSLLVKTKDVHASDVFNCSVYLDESSKFLEGLKLKSKKSEGGGGIEGRVFPLPKIEAGGGGGTETEWYKVKIDEYLRGNYSCDKINRSTIYNLCLGLNADKSLDEGEKNERLSALSKAHRSCGTDTSDTSSNFVQPRPINENSEPFEISNAPNYGWWALGVVAIVGAIISASDGGSGGSAGNNTTPSTVLIP